MNLKITDSSKVSTSNLMLRLKNSFTVYSYWNDEELDTNFPKPKKPTTRHFALEQESPDLKGKSWDEMKDHREEMMTFREYILFFEAYHKETGKYPDGAGWTVFRDALPDGKVARGSWNPYVNFREVGFYWLSPGDSAPFMGARLALAISTSTLKLVGLI